MRGKAGLVRELHEQRDAGRCALLPDGDEFSINYTEGYDRDDCEHWELRLPTK